MFHTCPLNPAIESQRDQFFDGTKNAAEGYTAWYNNGTNPNDATHPNVYGAQIQARTAIGFLQAVYGGY